MAANQAWTAAGLTNNSTVSFIPGPTNLNPEQDAQVIMDFYAQQNPTWRNLMQSFSSTLSHLQACTRQADQYLVPDALMDRIQSLGFGFAKSSDFKSSIAKANCKWDDVGSNTISLYTINGAKEKAVFFPATLGAFDSNLSEEVGWTMEALAFGDQVPCSEIVCKGLKDLQLMGFELPLPFPTSICQ